jgi:hypothetical protein
MEIAAQYFLPLPRILHPTIDLESCSPRKFPSVIIGGAVDEN